MRNRLDQTFKSLSEQGEGCLMVYFTSGDPDFDTTIELVLEAERAGADVVELGIPHSDPVADGPVIQASDLRALQSGTTPKSVLDLINEVRRRSDIPLVILTYCNLIMKYGMGEFAEDFGNAGIDGLIVVDLPLEESLSFRDTCDRAGIYLIYLVTPTTTGTRMEKILGASKGFSYLVSVLGVTGVRDEVDTNIVKTIDMVRDLSDIPLVAGFGVSNKSHVQLMMELGTDGVVVGSALIKVLEGHLDDPRKAVIKVGEMISELKEGTLGVKKTEND